jgi:hypothetical protein
MAMAGAKPMNRLGVISERTPDYTSPERAAHTDLLAQRGSAPGLATDSAMAQVTAGAFQLPSFAAVPVDAGAR